MKFRLIDIIITCYVVIIITNIVFLIISLRLDMLMYAGSLAIIPLIIIIIRKRLEKKSSI